MRARSRRGSHRCRSRSSPLPTATTRTRSGIADRLRAEGYRVDLRDASDDTLGARVRRAKLEKIPYVLVVGDDDVENGTVGVNRRGADRPERGVAVERSPSSSPPRSRAPVARVALERLWAGWRGEYVANVANDPTSDGGGDGGCLFCRLAASTDEDRR